MGILEAHSFGLRVRRFVLDLFDKGMVRNFILDGRRGERLISIRWNLGVHGS